MVVDADVEIQNGEWPWRPCAIDERVEREHGRGPWSVPQALEVARAILYHLHLIGVAEYAKLRVIDTAGVVVEQWPKVS
jgi:hypothetical protein